MTVLVNKQPCDVCFSARFYTSKKNSYIVCNFVLSKIQLSVYYVAAVYAGPSESAESQNNSSKVSVSAANEPAISSQNASEFDFNQFFCTDHVCIDISAVVFLLHIFCLSES